MNETEESKRVVLRFFDHICAGNIPGLLDCLGDDAEWLVVGHPEVSPAVGVKDKRNVRAMFEGMAALFPQGLRIAPTGLTAEGERVAVEAESSGVKTDGKHYNNFYHFLCVVRACSWHPPATKSW